MIIILLSRIESLEIYAPESLRNQFKNVEFSIANFGNIPFGTTLVGGLFVQSSDACNPDDLNFYKNISNPIVLISRGNCTFVKKVRNAQNHGAQLVIIEDGLDHDFLVVMADDGNGYDLQIPSIFITHQNGQRLRKMFKNNKNILVKVKFISKKLQRAEVKAYLDIQNILSFTVLQEVAEVFEQLQGKFDFDFSYNLYKTQAESLVENDCYGEGKYCISLGNDENGNRISGKLALNQIIRQRILLDSDQTVYFKYMKEFSQHCSNDFFKMEECSLKLIKQFIKNFQTFQKNYSKSFVGSGAKTENKILDKIQTQSLSLYRLPALYGTIKQSNIKQAICASLIEVPYSCQAKKGGSWLHSLGMVLVLVFSVLLLGGLGVIGYRKLSSRIGVSSQSEMREIVGQYVQFYKK